ncbi:hypothetical protein [Herbidospora mongoliensis]|uniref:hypothetical protein n=1 Tax=Herbidospora mongoliensis TaxID=688067 RepID=UPI0008296434|nr:hypothetical protein [Herbidospora mongoliensis]
MYRQGDILIMPVPEASVPPGLAAEPRDAKGRIVLALGEATGHAHALHGPGTLYRGYLHLPEGGRLVHEEHATIPLPKGWFRIVRQREYVPGSFRVVAD